MTVEAFLVTNNKVMFSDHQSLYFAHWLTLKGRSDNQISRAMASARVDMNPHQIEAAIFALKSPIAKGVLLADEVGLGKTIEASLVMAQKWAEKKRSILLVVPASLRKQWFQELADKFELPSIILDGKIAKEQINLGLDNPFKQKDKIVICSYEYVSRQKERVSDIPWNLVVFDEAHKLRNLYKKRDNKTAKNIHQATLHAESKVLLSATPLQNNLMELYGLAKAIDEHFFGDDQSFKALYVNRQKNKAALADLKSRIKPICHRTLRRQVQEEGGINFTDRFSITQDFTPNEDEWDLYLKISAYLQRDHIYSIQPNARHLVTIGMRKILASSSFALAGTLERMILRLENEQLSGEEAIADLEEADDWQDRFTGDGDERFVNQKLIEEIEELKSYHRLAKNISLNAKGEALIVALDKALEFAQDLGSLRKAVIFTESCRTQIYIKELLDNHGYKGRLVLLNGSNNDPGSKQIVKDWLQKHQGSARITGSKTADMKAALVDKFASDEADILISTEAGAEGINLQFCSLLINYDLPWNPQKVEQRIGRVHRYGQKHDVVVVNFLNRKNPADKRVFELLNEKFKLFNGVFGASDEILGAIESDIDIEKRIYEIYQKCRTDEEIEYQFNQLQEDLEDVLQVREEQTRKTLLNNFDRDVVTALKSRRDSSRDFLDEYEQVLMDLAKAEIPDAEFGRNYFHYKNNRYDLSWEQAQKNDSEFFRLQAEEHKLAWELVHKARARKAENKPLAPVNMVFHSAQLGAQYAALEKYMGQSGLLQVEKLLFNYAGAQEEHLLVAVLTDAGQRLDADDAEHLLRIPSEILGPLNDLDTTSLKPVLKELADKKKLETENKLEQYFEQESSKLERWADDRRQALQLSINELDREIREMKKASRQLSSLQEKIDAKRQIKQKERERDTAMVNYHETKKEIEQQEDKLLDEIESKLKLDMQSETLFKLRWSLRQ